MHFLLAVFTKGKDEVSLENSLNPYQEAWEEGNPFVEFEERNFEVKKEWESNTLEHKVSEKDIKLSMTHKELYKDIKTFATEYFGYLEKDGDFGCYSNPEGRWDWWEVGGRWSGKLLPKGESLKGCNCLKVKQIDFEKMDKVILNRAKQNIKTNNIKDKTYLEKNKEWYVWAYIDLEGVWNECESEGKYQDNKDFREYIKDHQNSFLTIVDCHV